tara:strand:- start:122 stop:373 length:252 start_codon:yes stop_codon:yes gene_type:complete
MTKTRNTCLHCNAAKYSRGLCSTHYQQAAYLVRVGRATWIGLQRKAQALAAGEQAKQNNPFTDGATSGRAVAQGRSRKAAGTR